jgi:HPt (histidine-containing phosphotransfer) domain-containing protein
MENQVIIDPNTFNQLKDMVGADFIQELIDTYIVETADLITQLRKVLVDQDAAAFGRLAHSIKSSSASLGALAFSQQARELEMMGKANDLANAGPKLEKLRNDFLVVKDCLEGLKDEQ